MFTSNKVTQSMLDAVSKVLAEEEKKISQKVFVCPDCEEEFASKAALKSHFRAKHKETVAATAPADATA